MDRGTIHLIANTSIGLIAAVMLGIIIWFLFDIPIWGKCLLSLADLFIFAATSQYVAPFFTMIPVNKICDRFNIQYANNWEEWAHEQRKKGGSSK